VLGPGSRLRAASDWAAIRGATAGRTTIVVRVGHVEGDRRLAGLSVSRAVGSAVTRNTIKRRLRAILGSLLPELPPGTGIIVRAQPQAARASFAEIEADVRGAVAAALGKAGT